jgi:hypothetical protein
MHVPVNPVFQKCQLQRFKAGLSEEKFSLMPYLRTLSNVLFQMHYSEAKQLRRPDFLEINLLSV